VTKCNPSIYCSRVCEKGTKGCDVPHLEVEALATEFEDFKVFAKQQGYSLVTTKEKGTIATENGVGPATFYSDAAEHAWRGWVHGRSEKRNTRTSVNAGQVKAELFDVPQLKSAAELAFAQGQADAREGKPLSEYRYSTPAMQKEYRLGFDVFKGESK